MDLNDARADVLVAAGVAGCTIGVTLLLAVVLAAEASVLLRGAPLSVYFLYLFVHDRLPAGLDRPRNWIGLAALVSLGVVGYALL
jgi:hypothetical protein